MPRPVWSEATAGSDPAVASIVAAMRGYDDRSYGEGFADVYDDWYADVTDVDATVARVAALAGPGGSVLELGVGTGRLAVPLARAGLRVTGVDSSPAMLDRLAAHDPDGLVDAVCGDMVSDLPATDDGFDVALVAVNTLFNIVDPARQQRCFHAVAARLRPGGRFVVEAFVPDAGGAAEPGSAGDPAVRSDVSVRSMTADRVVLSVSQHRPGDQCAEGQFVEITESGGVRLRPWSIRWATPAQLDEMASTAGFVVEARSADMAGAPFDDDSSGHVTVYRREAAP